MEHAAYVTSFSVYRIRLDRLVCIHKYNTWFIASLITKHLPQQGPGIADVMTSVASSRHSSPLETNDL